ncbi:MAG: 5'-nucleotidase C-terminal domain-containing protein [Sulfitobacter sp.]
MTVIHSRSAEHKRDPKGGGPIEKTAQLRILATTDIHMQLVGHDYITDKPATHKGLASIATLIEQARTQAHDENRGCILLDNGDMLQGTVMGDILAMQPVDAAHPVVASINALHFDAIGIGNHDLDYGLPYLNHIAAKLNMPVISTNLITNAPSALQNTAIIDCLLPAAAHEPKDHLRIGILSALPAKTAIWNRHLLEGQARVADAPETLMHAALELRQRGAHLVVLLAHMGIGSGPSNEEDSALSLAHIPGIDAIITGHTHQRFPGVDHANRRGVDADTGTLAQRPAIMPGHAGSDLAVLDLTLKKSISGDWQVIGHVSKLRSNTPRTPAAPMIAKICAPAHQMTRNHLAAVIGETDHAMHNYFSLATPTPIAELTARAKARVVGDALSGTPDAKLPLIASVSAHTAGGRGGPDHYLSIPKGPVLRRHIAGLSPYANQIWALRITGTDLLAMLEQSASVFQKLSAHNPDQMLIDSHIPAFNFDTVFGVSYSIDPTKTAGRRIKSLKYDSRIIKADDHFILATNQFRAAGGGGYAPLPGDAVIHRSPITSEAALIGVLAHPADMIWPSQTPWSFDCKTTAKAMLHTSPAALGYLDEIADLSPQHCGTTPDGFAKLRLTL